jgi:uncharacterized protein (DUF736 family)|tara:strand:- start:287 stop:688 length:402 start_codon:yes stop_codon:yes gene_type:complete
MTISSNKYDNTNKGVLYKVDPPKKVDGKMQYDYLVTKSGKMNFEGQEARVLGVQRKNKENKTILSFYVEIGNIQVNEQKQGNDRDFKGQAQKLALTDSFWVSGWNNVSDKGTKYMSLQLKKKVEEEQYDEIPI